MIEIRTCDSMDEYDACVELEVETWAYDATELIPRKAFLLAHKIGGQTIGAFDKPEGDDAETQKSARLIGFAMSLPGIRQVGGKAQPYLHSHMLAVRPEYQNRGIGVQIKLFQRLEALGRGVNHMQWTFDPMQIKNAFLNIHRLGAIVRTYKVDFYGVSSSRLQGGLPTDRLLAEWELDSPRVQAHLDGRPSLETAVEERILVPASIAQRKAGDEDRKLARAVQMENRRKFQAAFSQGLAVVGFSLNADGDGVYELGAAPQTEPVLTSKGSL